MSLNVFLKEAMLALTIRITLSFLNQKYVSSGEKKPLHKIICNQIMIFIFLNKGSTRWAKQLDGPAQVRYVDVNTSPSSLITEYNAVKTVIRLGRRTLWSTVHFQRSCVCHHARGYFSSLAKEIPDAVMVSEIAVAPLSSKIIPARV
jgi:hypothetical protein